MSAEKRALVASWWTRASEDLRASLLLVDGKPPALAAAVYHCQQAAEKSLKAWLVWQEIPFPKIHDLDKLLNLCSPVDSGFESLRLHAAILTPYVAEFRYPGEDQAPSPEDTQEAIRLATDVTKFIQTRIPFLNH
jgi:HEPN domain-containing protein